MKPEKLAAPLFGYERSFALLSCYERRFAPYIGLGLTGKTFFAPRMKSPTRTALFRLLLSLAAGMCAVAATAYVIAQIQAQLKEIGRPLPDFLFQAVLAGGVVYVAIWAMDLYKRQLKLFQEMRSGAITRAQASEDL